MRPAFPLHPAPGDFSLAGPEGLRVLSTHSDVSAPSPETFQARLQSRPLGALRTLRIRHTPMRSVRTEHSQHDSAPLLLISAHRMGEMTIQQNGQQAVAVPGSLSCLSTAHPFQMVTTAPAEQTQLIIPWAQAEHIAPQRDTPLPPVLPPSPLTNATAHFLTQLARELGERPNGEERSDHAELAALDLVRAALGQYWQHPPGLQDRGLFVREAALDVIERRHREESLTVTGIAAALHLSPRQLHRHFGAEEGPSLAERLADRRLETATRMLTTTRLPVAEIAHLAGFRSENAMRGHFRQRHDETPAEYRAMIRADRSRPGAAPARQDRFEARETASA